jgi:hypothetical protein
MFEQAPEESSRFEAKSQYGEQKPAIQIDPAAFVFRKTERLTICFFL